MEKEIHIWMGSPHPKNMFNTYQDTMEAVKKDVNRIDTPITNFCSTTYLLKGYRIFAHMLDSECVEITLGCKNINTDREIRVSHNIEKLLLANCFGRATTE